MSAKHTIPDKGTLELQYAAEGATISSLARKYNTSQPTVRKWLIEYDIVRKPHKQASKEANNRHRSTVKPDIESFMKDCSHLSIDQLERKYGVGQSTVYDWMYEYGIVLCHTEKVTNAKGRAREELANTSDVIVDYKHLKNIGSVATKHGVSYSFTRNLLHRNNVDVVPGKISQGHQYIIDFLKKNNIPFVVNDRSLIHPQEIDILIPDHKLAIEYCGLYWHCEENGKDKKYHVNKMNRVNACGYRLMTVFEHYNLDIVISMIRAHVGLADKIHGRKCVVKFIDYAECRPFERDNHLMGSRPASIYVGVFYMDVLVYTCSFQKARYNNKYQWELIRACSKQGVCVRGALSKCLSYFRSNYKGSIITYCDLTYGTGKGYSQTMNYSHVTSPNYRYFKSGRIVSRVSAQKHKLPSLLGELYNDNLSEADNMKAAGYNRYWDCGNSVYTID